MNDTSRARTDPSGEEVAVQKRPPWAPEYEYDPRLFTEAERFVAGALSTLPPFDQYHPQEALPFARQALKALGEWEPTDG